MEYQLLSVQVGKPARYPAVEPGGKPWRSGIVKKPVDGPVWVGRLGLEGDGQADRKHHGGPSRAVNVYPSEHYACWRAVPALAEMTGGGFGENFTTRGLLETTVCIGDVLAVGEAVLAVSQPRGPCYKLNRRWNYPDLQRHAEDERRFGWYLRVLQEGRVEAGAEIRLLERPFPEWTVARVWDVTRAARGGGDFNALLDVPALSPEWKDVMRKILAHST